MKNRIEVIANSILIAVGIVGGIVLYNRSDPGVSSVMFSIALACILYQFLGGISQDHSLQLGVIKLGGTAAVLVMFILFLNNYILKDKLVIKPDVDWLAISSEDGKTVNLLILHNNDTIYPSSKNVDEHKKKRSKQEFKLMENDSTVFSLQPSSGDEPVGFIDLNNSKQKSLFRKLRLSTDSELLRFYLTSDLKSSVTEENLREIRRGLPGFEWVNSNKQSKENMVRSLPFEIKLSGAKYSIIKDGVALVDKEDPVGKTCYIVSHQSEDEGSCSYLVILEQANFEKNKFGVKYIKWLVRRMNHVL